MLDSPFSCPFPAKMTTVIHLRDPWRVLSARWLDHTVDQRQHDPHAYSGLKYHKIVIVLFSTVSLPLSEVVPLAIKK